MPSGNTDSPCAARVSLSPRSGCHCSSCSCTASPAGPCSCRCVNRAPKSTPSVLWMKAACFRLLCCRRFRRAWRCRRPIRDCPQKQQRRPLLGKAESACVPLTRPNRRETRSSVRKSGATTWCLETICKAAPSSCRSKKATSCPTTSPDGISCAVGWRQAWWQASFPRKRRSGCGSRPRSTPIRSRQTAHPTRRAPWERSPLSGSLTFLPSCL